MADPASLADRARELAGDAGRLVHNLEAMAQQLAAQAPAAAPAGGASFVYELTIFVLAVFVGYHVVWRVTPALHSPLMSVTNAISSVIIVGALLAAGTAGIGCREDHGVCRGRARRGQHIRRVHRDPAHAADVPAKEITRRFVSENLAAFFYLIASICFILALRGLSSPRTARTGNFYGIAGMVIAVGTTLLAPHVVSYGLIVAGIVIGGAVGTYIALKIQMTALPQLVAAFHSLVGLAAVCVAIAAFSAPQDFGIGMPGAIERGEPASRCRSAWRSAPSPSPARSSPSPNCRGWSPAGHWSLPASTR